VPLLETLERLDVLRALGRPRRARDGAILSHLALPVLVHRRRWRHSRGRGGALAGGGGRGGRGPRGGGGGAGPEPRVARWPRRVPRAPAPVQRRPVRRSGRAPRWRYLPATGSYLSRPRAAASPPAWRPCPSPAGSPPSRPAYGSAPASPAAPSAGPAPRSRVVARLRSATAARSVPRASAPARAGPPAWHTPRRSAPGRSLLPPAATVPMA